MPYIWAMTCRARAEAAFLSLLCWLPDPLATAIVVRVASWRDRWDGMRG